MWASVGQCRPRRGVNISEEVNNGRLEENGRQSDTLFYCIELTDGVARTYTVELRYFMNVKNVEI